MFGLFNAPSFASALLLILFLSCISIAVFKGVK